MIRHTACSPRRLPRFVAELIRIRGQFSASVGPAEKGIRTRAGSFFYLSAESALAASNDRCGLLVERDGSSDFLNAFTQSLRRDDLGVFTPTQDPTLDFLQAGEVESQFDPSARQ